MSIWIPGPSFSRSLARASRNRQYPVSRAMLSKTGTRRVLKAIKAPVPQNFRSLGTIATLTAESLAEPTVIKPVQGSNNRGVLPLVPVGPDAWHDVEHGEVLSLERIREQMARELVQHGLTDTWIGEELLRGPDGTAIEDVKFMMFRGRVGAAFVRRNPAHTFTWFDPEWNPLRSGIRLHPNDPTVMPPLDRDRLTELAVRISRALPIPFVRIDLYSTDRGPVAGELTPYPGWGHDLDQELDERFGLMYEEAENELIAAGMDWSRLTDVARLPAIIAEFSPRSGGRG